MKATFLKLAGASILSAALLTGCGGGGGGSSDNQGPVNGGGVPSTLTFHPLAGYQSRLNAGASDSFSVKYQFQSGATCVGSASIITQPAEAATFEGVNSYAVEQNSTLDCGTSSSQATGHTYYDVRNYGQIGLESSSSPVISTEYDVYVDLPNLPPTLPTDGKVNDTGDLATFNIYTKSDKATLIGKRVISYAIEADTTQTAVLNVINKAYDTNNQLLSTQQSRYVMSSDNKLTYLSIDVQYSTTSTDHIVYTKPQ